MVRKAVKAVKRHPTKAVKRASNKPIKAAKPVKATKSPEKKKRKPSLGHMIYNTMIETLEFNSLGGGDFNLPSILTRYLDKNDPRHQLGLHREYYIPIYGTAPFYRVGEERLRMMLGNQAGLVMPAFSEGFEIKQIDDPDVPLCDDCR